MVQNFDTKTKHTTLEKKYTAEYSEEINLNDDFHKFVATYLRAYQGRNTAQDQIGAKFDTSEL